MPPLTFNTIPGRLRLRRQRDPAEKNRGGNSSSAENDGLQFFSGSLVISSL